MKIGIATPCHVNDLPLLSLCKQGINALEPKPFRHKIHLNKGESSLKKIKEELYDETFRKCDVLLACSADFYLFPHILSYVKRNQVVNFAQLDMPLHRFLANSAYITIRLIYPWAWTGCFSMPKEVWKIVKPSWDGSDGSVKEIIGKNNYKFVRHPQYYAIRPYRDETTLPKIAGMPLLKRLKWRLLRIV